MAYLKICDSFVSYKSTNTIVQARAGNAFVHQALSGQSAILAQAIFYDVAMEEVISCRAIVVVEVCSCHGIAVEVSSRHGFVANVLSACASSSNATPSWSKPNQSMTPRPWSSAVRAVA